MYFFTAGIHELFMFVVASAYSSSQIGLLVQVVIEFLLLRGRIQCVSSWILRDPSLRLGCLRLRPSVFSCPKFECFVRCTHTTPRISNVSGCLMACKSFRGLFYLPSSSCIKYGCIHLIRFSPMLASCSTNRSNPFWLYPTHCTGSKTLLFAIQEAPLPESCLVRSVRVPPLFQITSSSTE